METEANLHSKRNALNRETWARLTAPQKVNLSMMLFLLVSLPLAVLIGLTPTKLFSRAYLPTTPPITPPTATYGSTPTLSPVRNQISWITDQVYLTADNFRIRTNNNYFYDNNGSITVHSDPGDPTYTTLESIWYENGVEMRLFMYFHSDGKNWWMSEMRIYNGKNPADWIYSYNVVSPRPLGTPFYGNYGFGMGLYYEQSQVYFEHLVLLPFRNGIVPTVTQQVTTTPTPRFTPTPNNTIILNSVSGKSCDSLCSQRGMTCQSVGTDSEGNNGRSWQSYRNSCAEIITACDGVMKKTSKRVCSGKDQPWTNCNCQ